MVKKFTTQLTNPNPSPNPNMNPANLNLVSSRFAETAETRFTKIRVRG